MINQIAFQNCLKNAGVEFITGVPDTLLNEFCLSIEENWPKNKHIIAANEGNAAALACGYHLSTGSVPLVYMQNSGMGNTLNPLLSLSNKDVYGIPMVLLIGWRGDPNEKDHLQHKKQGELTPVLLDALDIPYKILEDNEEDVLAATNWAINEAKSLNSPVGLIAKKNVFENGQKTDLSKEESKFELFREDVIENLIDHLPKDTIYVASTGRATRELYFLREHRGESHENDFLNIGAMGHSSSIAAGIALSQKERLVVCLDGDCAAIMHMGAFAIQGNLEVTNLLHVVMNNGIHESVGGQTSVGFQINLTQIAENTGYSTIQKPVQSASDFTDSINILLSKKRPSFIEVHIKKGMRSKLPPLDIIPGDLKYIGFKNKID
jgi:phosphonopyruvate decarboxylase